MTLKQQIGMAAGYAGKSLAELARSIDNSPQNFNLKLKRETLTREDMEKIAKALGAEYEYVSRFNFPDGMQI